jgi:hypothetical protein
MYPAATRDPGIGAPRPRPPVSSCAGPCPSLGPWTAELRLYEEPVAASELSCTAADEPQLATALLDPAACAVPSKTPGADGEPAD